MYVYIYTQLKMRVIATLTTLPGREPKLFQTLKALNEQDYKLDKIYLTIPKISKRLGISYPEFSREIQELCTIVECDQDYGPLTKIVGGLLMEENPETIIITFDDDVKYSTKMVSSLLKYYNKLGSNVAIGSSGTLIKYSNIFYSTTSNANNNFTIFNLSFDDTRKVDILCGFSSILYTRKFFPVKEELHDKFLKFPLLDENLYYNDDVYISGYISSKNITRYICKDIPESDHYNNIDVNKTVNQQAISYDKIKFFDRFNKSILKAKELGHFQTTENVSIYETCGFKLIIIIIIVILIILLLLIILLDNNYMWFF